MNPETMADILIEAMPWSLGLKAIAFSAVMFLLWHQSAPSRLAIAINTFFALMVLNSIWTTWLGQYLTRRATGQEASEWSWEIWVLLIGLNIFPFLVSVSGFAVVYYNRHTEIVTRGSEQDQRDVEQNEREVFQNGEEQRISESREVAS